MYIANLPPNYKETDLENLLSKYGQVVSTRILRDQQGQSKGKEFKKKNYFCSNMFLLFGHISKKGLVSHVWKIGKNVNTLFKYLMEIKYRVPKIHC